jgi:transposase InsO family protein
MDGPSALERVGLCRCAYFARRQPALWAGSQDHTRVARSISRRGRRRSGPRYPAQRASRLAPEILALLEHARRELEYGAARTRVWLRRVHNVRLPMATIHRAFCRLGLPHLPRRRKREPRPKQLRLFEKANPGDSIQIDVKVVKVNARNCFQYTALDDCTRLRVLHLSREQNQRSNLAFLEQVRRRFPFPIQKIQTDHGTEFSLDFVLAVEQAGIRHRYIKPRRPQQNGKVERSHRIDNEEFWGRQCFLDFQAAATALPAWERRYNFERFSLALNGDTPVEKLARRLPDAKIA